MLMSALFHVGHKLAVIHVEWTCTETTMEKVLAVFDGVLTCRGVRYQIAFFSCSFSAAVALDMVFEMTKQKYPKCV